MNVVHRTSGLPSPLGGRLGRGFSGVAAFVALAILSRALFASEPQVVVFLGTECPLAKRYGPRLAELARDYESQGVQFVAVNSNEQDTLREIAHYARVHKI